MNLFLRDKYISKIKPFMNQSLIKVIIGQRRVGKSYILLQLMEIIKSNQESINIISVNKERYEFDWIKNYEDLIEFVSLNIDKERKNYLFIDEIQDIIEFEKALRHLAIEPNLDIYCTGSNANLLSGELATYLSGRYVEFTVHGLSYMEFIQFYGFEDTDDTLSKYLLWGSLPFIVNLPKDNDVIEEYLQNIFSTILYKDIVKRFNVRNTHFLENLIQFLANNVGNIISAKKISDYLKSERVNMSPQSVLNYIDNLKQAFLIHPVKRQDLKGKKIFETNEKIFFEDWGIMNSLIGFQNNDIGKIIENVIYNHLKINGFKVMIGKIGDKEIDFVAEKKGEKLYIQACYLLADEKVIEREYGSLLEINDNHPKLVVSLDKFAPKNKEGVVHLHLKDFLNTEY